MRKEILLISFILFHALPSLAQQNYVNQSMGFSLKLPEGWEVQMDLKKSVVLATSEKYPDSGLALASCIILPLENTEGKGLDDFLSSDYAQIAPKVSVIEKGETVVNNRKALWLRYEEKSPIKTHETDLRLKYYFMPTSERVYTFSFFGDKNYLSEIAKQTQEILNSLKFGKVSE